MLTDKECVFCQIVARAIPTSIVYDDRRIMALMTVKPFNPGHTLVVPKRHCTNLGDLDDETGAHLFRIAKRAARAIRKSSLRCEGISLYMADGEPDQKILHLHLHVFPRFRGDGFSLESAGNAEPSRVELDRIARMIRDVF
jgi:histidine triad (HIT) family protein